MIRHIQSSGIVRTVYLSVFQYIEGYLGMLMHIQPHSQARNYGGGGRTPLPFFENRKKCPGSVQKRPLFCPTLG